MHLQNALSHALKLEWKNQIPLWLVEWLLVMNFFSLDHGALDDVCSQPKETGICKALFYRFFFNQDTEKCEEFVYGGEQCAIV